MTLGCIAQVLAVAVAAALGLERMSFWWCLIPAFIAGSLAVSNGPSFDLVMSANKEGRLSVLPLMILRHSLPWLAVSGAVYWIARALS